MAEEMRFHLEERTADQIADGLSPAEARNSALRKFGNLASIQEQAREGRGWRWLENFFHDLRLGVRSLYKTPGFSLIAIVTLGLGIGANTAMYSMFIGVMQKPLPYPTTDSQVRLYRATAQNPEGNLAPADFIELQHAREAFGDTAAYTPANVSLSEPGRPAEMASGNRCSVNLFALLGIQPQLGRDFHPDEDAPGRDRVVILSHRTWLNRYDGDPDIVNRTVRIDGEPHQVIGVLPLSFNDWRHLGGSDFFRPLAFSPAQTKDRTTTTLRVLIQRNAGHTLAEVVGLVANLGERLAKEYPVENAGSTWRVVPLQDSILPQSANVMIGMMVGLSTLVLLIACSNLANLLLARTMARAREFAVRAALGASRTQLLRPLLAESLLLSLAGGICAIFVALWFMDYLAMRSTGDNGEQVVIDLGWQVFVWAGGASLFTAVAFGIAPALFARRLDLNQTLKSGGRGTTGGRGPQRFRQVIIVGQFAVAMVLLAGAGVHISGLHELNNRRAGWDSERLVTGHIVLPTGGYGDDDKITAFQHLASERLTALPGVTSASFSSFAPFLNWGDVRKFVVGNRESPPPGQEPTAAVNAVSPAYFDTVGTRVLAGRAFAERDTATAPRVCMVSEKTARSLFGDENPVGRRLAPLTTSNPDWAEIVGVVSDVESAVKNTSPVTLQVYFPLDQEPRRQLEVAVRTSGMIPTTLVDSIRGLMTTLDPDLPVRRLQPADASIERANYQIAFGRDIFSGMAVLGLALASLGIYGIIAWTMAQRTGEFAIRLALGARIGDLTRLVLLSGVKLALVGSALGVFAAYGLVRLMANANSFMRMDGPAVLFATTLLLVGVALLACWIPARRASKVNAMTVLRAE